MPGTIILYRFASGRNKDKKRAEETRQVIDGERY